MEGRSAGKVYAREFPGLYLPRRLFWIDFQAVKLAIQIVIILEQVYAMRRGSFEREFGPYELTD